MSYLSVFSERLKELMFYNNNLQPKQLAEILNIHEDTVRLWLRTERNVSLTNIVKIADYFRCPIEFLIGRTDNTEFTPKPCPPFYQNLRKIMKEKGVTRYKIVKETKISDSYFTKLSNGLEPHLENLVILADELCCTLDYLVGRE